MKTLTMTAVVLASVSSVGLAGGQDDEWLKLDQEITSLSSTLNAQGGGIDIGALIRSSYVDVDDDLAQITFDGDDEDISGWVFQDVDVWLEGEIGDFDWRVSIDFDGGENEADFFDSFMNLASALSPEATSGTSFPTASAAQFAALTGQSINQGGGADLEDAYGVFNATDDIKLTFGQFKAPMLLSQMVDEENQLLINRTIMGSAFDNWSLGTMLHGDYENFRWFLAAQNGADGIADEYRLTARAEYSIEGGAGGREGVEGSYGASDELAATIGVAYREDDGIASDSQIIAVDGAATLGAISFAAEVLELDDDVGDGGVFAATVGYMISPDEVEAAFRFEDIDQILDLQKLTAGINFYQSGHNAKWSLNISDIDIDDLDVDGTVVELGLTLGSSRS